jgi:hypothetical protein
MTVADDLTRNRPKNKSFPYPSGDGEGDEWMVGFMAEMDSALWPRGYPIIQQSIYPLLFLRTISLARIARAA